jgi:hypothetical protein
MQTSFRHLAVSRVAALAIVLVLPWSAAEAQLGNLLNQGTTNGATSGNAAGGLGNLGGLGSLSGSSLTSNSLGNVTGLLQYCIKNNYLSASSAGNVKNSLLSKLPGGENTTDSGFTQGSNGILTSGNGSQVDLSGGGLKEAATRQVCDQILSQAKSML